MQYFGAIHYQDIGKLTITQGGYHQRQMDKAHGRHPA